MGVVSNNLTRVSNVSGAITYLEECLKSRSVLNDRLRDEIDLGLGVFYLPFEYQPKADQNYIFDARSSSIDTASKNLKEFVINYIEMADRNNFLVSDFLSRKGDPYLAKVKCKLIYEDNLVYMLCNRIVADKAILRDGLQVAFRNRSVSVLAQFDSDYVLSNAQLAVAPWTVNAICVGAFDDMGVLIWMPS